MRLTLLLSFLLCSIALFAQPANDECEDRIQLGQVPLCPVMGVFTNVEATPSVISDEPTFNKPACFNGAQPDNDVWFSFIVPADGSAPDLIIEVTPSSDGDNTPITQPQVAAYRGVCGEDELAEVGCASAAFGEEEISLELFALQPGAEIFLRIEDWTASATSNEGDFALCIKAPDPIFTMGEDTESSLCSGTLFDSGGPDNDYSNNENSVFTICPSSNFSCIELDFISFNTETNFDEINIYQGSTVGAELLIALEGAGGPQRLNLTSDCVTIQLTSDGSVTNPGFEMNWSCTTGDCENPFSTCDNPTVIDNLPYTNDNLTNCGALNSVTFGPCGNVNLLNGEDHFLAYTSPGNECISAIINNANTGTALSVYNNCPDVADQCLGSDIVPVGSNTATVFTYLEEPGTYFFTVDNAQACSDFDIIINSVECPNAAPVTCENPNVIEGLPFMENASTCGASDSEGTGPCDFGTGPGEDVVFSYTTNGNECLSLNISNAGEGTSVSVYDNCVDDNPACFGYAEVPLDADESEITLIRFVEAGTYYFVVETTLGCSFFDLEINNIDCPVELPPAANCEDALNINGCGNIPQIINIDQMVSTDTTVYMPGINDGCWSGVGQSRYTFFTFEAQENGEFGFLARNADEPTFSDIDFQVWGPFAEDSLRCDVMQMVQPLRSSWAAPSGLNLTGLVNISPETGETINDTCEDAGGDGYVSTIPVNEGEWYLVLINDFSGTIEMGGVFMDFSSTTPGVLGPLDQTVMISPDTVICPGNAAQLMVEGGIVYDWLNNEDGLNCNNCPDPIATVDETTTFQVMVSDACDTDTLEVEVVVLIADAGTDAVSCLGEPLVLNGQPANALANGTWIDNTAGLSCTDCPNPVVDTESLGTGEYTFIYQVSGPDCNSVDTVTIMVLDIPAPDYEISDDLTSCDALEVSLGGAADPDAIYSWTSVPAGFTSDEANPLVTVSETTTYILSVSNQECPQTIIDSVTIEIGFTAQLPELVDQVLCNGENFTLNAAPQSGVSYQWSPASGVSNPNQLSTTFSPTVTTTYILTATAGDCTVERSFLINVGGLTPPTLSVTDAQSVCTGDNLILTADINIPGTVQWPNATGEVYNTGPILMTQTITATFIPDDLCFAPISATVDVEAIPAPNFPPLADQNLCGTTTFTLTGLMEVPGATYNWTPVDGVMDPESLNTIFTAEETTTYQVIGNVAACADTASFTIEVNTVPVIEINTPAVGCEGMPATLSASANVAGTFTWNPGELTGDEVIVEGLTDTTLFTVSFAADNDCPVADETVLLPVVPGIVIEEVIADPSMDVVEGDPVVLSVVTDPDTGVSYQWETGGTGASEMVIPLMPPAAQYSVTVTDVNGCTDEGTVSFEVIPARYGIPNAFTPDTGNGMNTVFQVETTGGNIDVIAMKIWNRYGKLVHEGRGDSHGWNGRVDGKLAASDVYVYMVEIQLPDGSVVTEQGDLTLIR